MKCFYLSYIIREIATTQSSTESNNVNWGGSIIAKSDHTTPCDDFFDNPSQVQS